MGPHWGAGGGTAPWSNTGGSGAGLLGPLFWLLVVAAIVAVVVIGTAYLLRATPAAVSPDRATETLRERYARGELTDEEFETRSKRLSEATADPHTTTR